MSRKAEPKSRSPGGIVFLILIGVVIYFDPSIVGQISSALPKSGSSSAIALSGSGTVAQEQAYAQQVFGNDAAQQNCLVLLWNQESGWSATAVNQQSGAYGIPQALPSAQGHPYSLGDWKAQINWGKAYIDQRYGSPCNAWAHEQSNNWY